MVINEKRQIEEMVGSNRGIIRQKLARIHCMTSVLAAARECRPKTMRSVPVALRRGWVKCVMETVAEYRGTYIGVMNGTSLEPRSINWRS
jgi:hypothetical protein